MAVIWSGSASIALMISRPCEGGKEAHAAEEQAEQHEDGHLRGERLGRGHADLGPRIHVDPAVGLAGKRASHVVADAEHAVALAPRLAQRAERVLGLAALADGQNQRAPVERRVAQAEFARPVDFHRQVGQGLDDVFADDPGVHRRAAAGDEEAVDFAQRLRVEVEAAQLRRAFLDVEPAADRVLHRERLLEDFLEHVVRKVAEVGVGRLEVDLADLQALFIMRERLEPVTVAVDRHDIIVAQVGDGLRVSDDGRDVAGQEMARARRCRAPGGCRAAPRP